MKTNRTRTLLFGVFMTADRPLTASEVSRLAAPLGIRASNVKSHLTRLVSEGALQRSGPVRLAKYAPAPSQVTIADGINARLREAMLEPQQEPWDGGWLMLVLRRPDGRSERERIRTALWFDGFRATAAAGETYVRPAWPARWALSRASSYAGICTYGGLLAPIGRPVFDAMYSLNDFDREAKTLARWIHKRKIPSSQGRAFAELLDVGGRVARLIAHDPRLPRVLWGNRTGLRELVVAFRRFEKHAKPAAGRFILECLGGPK